MTGLGLPSASYPDGDESLGTSAGMQQQVAQYAVTLDPGRRFGVGMSHIWQTNKMSQWCGDRRQGVVTGQPVHAAHVACG